MIKLFYVKRDDEKHGGSVVDIPESMLEETLRRNPKWKVLGEVMPDLDDVQIKPPKFVPTPECPLCGKEMKDEEELKKHKKNHK